MTIGMALASAQGSRFVVEIVGAGVLTPLLQEHLSVIRATRDTAIDAEEWQGLIRRSPQQIRELLSTEGFFSVKIQSENFIEAGRHVVRFHIDPGEPVRVTEIRLEFTGDISSGGGSEPERLTILRNQ